MKLAEKLAEAESNGRSWTYEELQYVNWSKTMHKGIWAKKRGWNAAGGSGWGAGGNGWQGNGWQGKAWGHDDAHEKKVLWE